MQKKDVIAIAALTIVLMASLLPFAGKAFHIDDTLFLYSAQSILNNFARPYDFNVNWFSYEDHGWNANKNPPVCSYILAFLMKIFSDREAPLHIAFIAFPALSIICMYFLSRRFVKHELLPAVFLFISPAFFISSTSLMSDIPQLAFYLAALLLYIRAVEKDSITLFVFSGFLAGLAILTKYTAATIVVVFVLYSIIFKKSFSKSWLSCLIPLAMLGLWGLHGIYFYGKPHFMTLSEDVLFFWEFATPFEMLLINLTEFLIFLSGCSLFAVFTLSLSRKNKEDMSARMIVLIILLSVMLTMFVLSFFGDRRNSFDFILAFMFIFLSVSFLSTMLSYLLRERKDKICLFLFAWFALNSAQIAVNYTVAARFILMALPPMALLLLYMIEKSGLFDGACKKFIYSGSIVIFILTLLMAHSDYYFARSYKNFSWYLKQAMPEKRIWFVGHWGFQYYMQKYGYKALDFLNASLEKGDIIVVPISNTGTRSDKLNASIRPYEMVFVDKRRGLFKTMYKTGFYSYKFGPLPYMPGTEFSEKFQLYEVTEPLSGELVKPPELRKDRSRKF